MFLDFSADGLESRFIRVGAIEVPAVLLRGNGLDFWSAVHASILADAVYPPVYPVDWAIEVYSNHLY